MMNRTRGMLAASGLLVLLASRGLAADTASWRIKRGDVNILVPLKPGGAFTATTPSLGGTLTLEQENPVHLSGEISTDLATIDTGISLRNQHLREKYLEVDKGKGFAKAVMTDIILSNADGEAFEGRTAFTAILLLHGVKHPVAGSVDVHRDGVARRVRVEFPLILTDFGITPPEYLGVGVANKLLVKVQFAAVRTRESGN